MAVGPSKLTLRAYGVGFGDCFLLTFSYAGATGDRHMLIDFGTTQKPPNPRKLLMMDIAKDIIVTVGGHLHVIVATHRHTDHISGFATNAKKNGTGDLIASLKPDLVIQPWTEDLNAPIKSKGPGTGLTAAANDAFRLSLRHMQTVMEASLRQTGHLPTALREEIAFVGQNDLSNLSAVKNLAKMGNNGKSAYVFYDKKIPKLAALLPNVQVDVIGPPTIKQKADVVSQSAKNADEYWHFASFWGLRAATSELTDGRELFPRAPVHTGRAIPIENRWFMQRLKQTRGNQLLRIVRAMDNALNNTSVILLIKAGKKKFLFPGDAQWENWEHALKKNAKELTDVDVYKVGHHGSLNATPKTLWNAFTKKSASEGTKGRLCSVMSTRTDSKHGHRESGTEVPRDKLVNALRSDSELRSTQELEPTGDLVLKLEFDL